ncbi:MAG: recombinase family protein [Acidimicrobiia bacterium]|nr:recombinase family protein [Acidimicrobiia bacterium]
MRVIGYVRDAPGPDSGDSVFVQSEQIRRWVAHNRCQLLAVCQDTIGAGAADDRDGYRALLGIISAGHVDTVLIANLSVLSADIMVQEIMLQDLRVRKVSVISTDEMDLPALADPATDPGRLLIRDVLTKQQTYRGRFSDVAEEIVEADPDRDVLIELIPFAEEITPARAS